MHTFKIGETHFGIDLSESTLLVQKRKDGLVELTLDVAGDQATFDRLTEAEDGEWSWALYPPTFFIHGLPMSQEAADIAAPIHIEESGEDVEMGLYMMEYSDVFEVSLQLDASGLLLVQGRVDLWGKNLRFEIGMPCAQRAGT